MAFLVHKTEGAASGRHRSAYDFRSLHGMAVALIASEGALYIDKAYITEACIDGRCRLQLYDMCCCYFSSSSSFCNKPEPRRSDATIRPSPSNSTFDGIDITP